MPLDSPIHNLRGIPRFNAAETCSSTRATNNDTPKIRKLNISARVKKPKYPDVFVVIYNRYGRRWRPRIRKEAAEFSALSLCPIAEPIAPHKSISRDLVAREQTADVSLLHGAFFVIIPKRWGVIMATKDRSAKVETIRDCKDCPAPDNQEMAFRLLANFMCTESNYPSATSKRLKRPAST